MPTMTSKERVLAAFEHQEPDRVPRWIGASPEFWDKTKHALRLDDEGLRRRLGDDFRRVAAQYAGPEPVLSGDATWESPFGIQRRGIGYGQPLAHPLAGASSPGEVEAYPWPDPKRMDVSTIRSQAEPFARDYAILGGDWSPLWHDVIDLVGHEQLYYMMYDVPDVLRLIFEKVTDYYVAVSTAIFEEAADLIDIFFIGNDLGAQTGPLLGVEHFREFLAPSFRRLTDLGHHYDLKVMLHCCGGYRPLIPELIELGFDGLHALQPDADGMEPASLKQEFGSRILLNGAIDSHHILIDGSSPDWVRDRCREVLEVMMPGGGYVAGASHDTILEETPLENVLAMIDAIEDYGHYG